MPGDDGMFDGSNFDIDDFTYADDSKQQMIVYEQGPAPAAADAGGGGGGDGGVGGGAGTMVVHEFQRSFTPKDKMSPCILCHLTQQSHKGDAHPAAEQLMKSISEQSGRMKHDDLAVSVLRYFNDHIRDKIDDVEEFPELDLGDVKAHIATHFTNPAVPVRVCMSMLMEMLYTNNNNGVYTLDENGQTVLDPERSKRQLDMMAMVNRLSATLKESKRIK